MASKNANYSPGMLAILAVIALYMVAEYTWMVDIKIPPIDDIKIQEGVDAAYRQLALLSKKSGVFVRMLFCVLMLILSVSNLTYDYRDTKKVKKTLLMYSLYFGSIFILAVVNYLHPDLIFFLYPSAFLTVVFTTNYVADYVKNLLYRHKKAEPSALKMDLAKQDNDFSFNLKTDQGWINCLSPQQGIMLIGGAGAGKSYSVIEPFIAQSVMKGFTWEYYDFKFPTLTQEIYKWFNRRYNLLLSSKDYTQALPSLAMLNFVNMEWTHRCNPIHPDNLPEMAYAYEYTSSILKNLNKDWIKNEDFWAKSAMAFMTSAIWYFKKYHPEICTLPHVIAFCLSDYNVTVPMLLQDIECRGNMVPYESAMRNKAGNQISGQLGSLQQPLGRINTPNIAWVLSGDDFKLDLNNPARPTILCLGNDPTLQESLSAVCSLVSTVVMKLINQQGKVKSAYCLDEAPTLFIPGFHNLPATARSNGVVSLYAAQDISQIELMYGKDQARVIVANLGTQFYGMVNDLQTAEHASKIFGKQEVEQESNTFSKGAPSKNISSREKEVVTASKVMTQKKGHFVGKVADAENPFFDCQILSDWDGTPRDFEKTPLPPFIKFRKSRKQEGEMTPDEKQQLIRLILDKNFEKIQEEVGEVVEEARELLGITETAEK